MASSKILLVAVLFTMAVAVTGQQCTQSNLQPCIDALAGSCQSKDTCCAAIPTYSRCIGNACGLSQDAIHEAIKNQLSQMGFTCGSCMVYMSALHVFLFAVVAAFFNIRG